MGTSSIGRCVACKPAHLAAEVDPFDRNAHHVALAPLLSSSRTATNLTRLGKARPSMIDPLPAPPSIISDAVRPLAHSLGLHTLPSHIHEVLVSFLFYHVLDAYVSPRFSSWLVPKIYPGLPRKTAINWNIRVVSTLQAIFICCLAFWIMLSDEGWKTSSAQERIWGYNGAVGMTQAFAAGYFLWDTMISVRHLDVLGPGSLVHAMSALAIVTLGFVRILTH